jgi:hypothetical protein
MPTRSRRRCWRLTCAIVLPAALGGAGPVAAVIPASAAPSAAPAGLAGNYIWEADGVLVAVSTDGNQVLAYICNGNPDTKLTFADWFHGTLTGAHALLANPDGAHLNLYVHPWVADGEVTLENGDVHSFAAAPVSAGSDPAEFLRSEESFGGVTYLGGWIVPPTSADAPSGAAADAYSGVASGANEERCKDDCAGGAIIAVATGSLLAPPPLTGGDLSLGQESVPDIGTFVFTVCNRGACSRPRPRKGGSGTKGHG